MPQERYSIAEAQAALRVSKSTLEVWVKDAGLQQAVQKQRMPDDLRSHYLTREQLEHLAANHRRQVAEGPGVPDPLTSNLNDLFADVGQLKEQVRTLEARVTALEGKTEPG